VAQILVSVKQLYMFYVCFIFKLQPEDERLSSQENDVTVSITPNDHSNALHNDGLVEEHGGTPRGQPNQGKSTLLERSMHGHLVMA
jgi:hypothetical protein